MKNDRFKLTQNRINLIYGLQIMTNHNGLNNDSLQARLLVMNTWKHFKGKFTFVPRRRRTQKFKTVTPPEFQQED
ncbi:hypothetical protein P5673_006943 [Acropora cervicornis]|uniref:Uncharacterized protein n=1 Tax=Acropora cervicornis TaxID=6130 RepID=A0AAD9VC42_ACRCE|nr:hypothetical protein P5673_006943 [Acropora cervicornis]